MDEIKRLYLKKMSEIVNDRLHFAKEEDLLLKLGLVPCSVSLFGLLNNESKDVVVYIEKDILKDNLIAFHLNDNTATVFISINDMFLFLDSIECKYDVIGF